MGKYCYVASARRRARRLGAHVGRRGAGHTVSPRAQLVIIIIMIIIIIPFTARDSSFRLNGVEPSVSRTLGYTSLAT